MNKNTTSHGTLTASCFRDSADESIASYKKDGDVTVYKHLGEMYGMINGLVGTLKREQDRMVRLEEELEASMGAGLRTKIMGTVIDLQGEVDILRNLIQPPSSL